MSGQFFINAFLLAIIAGGIGFWWTSTRARELALNHARILCKREGVQLLDYTVALRKIRLGNRAGGSACLRRVYGFEFTAEGSYRDSGSVTLNGHTLINAYLPYTRDEDGNRVFVQ